MAFPESFVEEVRRAADIVRVISDHVALKKMGTSWKGLCPFHQEKTPSFNVRAEPAVFHCFGCGVGGDVFKFLMLHERLSFPEAVEGLARRHGVPVPENRFEAGPDRKEREEMLALMEAAAQHFTHTLWAGAGSKAREYLLGRGFKKETLEGIRAGAARDAWDDLLGALRGKFAPTALQAAGMALPRSDKSGYYDRFRNRAVFPILSESGKVVAFGARSLDGSEPKYLNSPETAIYQKSRTLYGLSWAKEAIRREGRVVLMEGYLDVARAREGGVEEAVATCGTALTPGQARLLHRFADRVVVNFDQDDAGQKAARKGFDALLEENLRVQVVELPEGHDPDTYLKAEGAPAYRERLAEAPDAVEWLVRRALAEHETRTPAGKAAYLNAILPTLARLESAVERAAWLPRVAEAGGLDEAAARDELRRALSGRAAVPGPEVSARPTPRPSLVPAEKLLLALLLREREGIDLALGAITDADIVGLQSAEVLRAAKTLYLRGERPTAAALAAALASDEARRMLTAIAVEGGPTDGVTPLDCVRELKSLPLKARMAEIQKTLKSASGPSLDALLREKNQIKRQIANL
ncbi:MAG TPA: DNA primase [Vicinamibacteria bacterium]|nr:DNA primase [Vicinamibacteria bacterium]